MSTFFDLSGQVALVTGASRGIGRAILDALAQHGATVIGTATTPEGAIALDTHIKANGWSGQGMCFNVNDAGATDTLFDAITSAFGSVSVLVNNAGITRDQLAMRMKDEEWDAVISTNLSSVFRLARASMRPMMKARGGRIINITSVVGTAGNPGQANYAAAKAGVAGMTRALARELGSRGITVNCIAPGFIDTDMTKSLSEAQSEALMTQIPLGRLGKPEDIAAAVVYLASPAAAYVTGTTLHVNGGMWMGG